MAFPPSARNTVRGCARVKMSTGTVGAPGRAVISAIADSLLTVLARPRRELGAVLQPDLGEHVPNVALHRSHRDVQLRGDRLVGEPAGDEAHDLELAGA